jgi:hypothetical protein
VTRTETISFEVRNRIGTILGTADSKHQAQKMIRELRARWGWSDMYVTEHRAVDEIKVVFRQRSVKAVEKAA